MPKIIKQRRHGEVSPDAGVLERIRPVASGIGSLKFSLYGRPKVGKTRLACTFPKPLLILGFEDGTASVVGSKGVEFVELRRTEEIQALTEDPIAAGRWATVVVDNGTKFRDMRVSEILGLDRAPVQKGWGFAGRDAWIECANSMKQLLRPLYDLANAMPLNVVMIAQEQNFSEEDGTSSSDLIVPAIGSAIGKSVCMFVNAESDYIGQCFIREQVESRPFKTGGKTIIKKVQTGKAEYCLRVGPHPIYMTGFRQPLGAPELPDVIVDPTYEKVLKLIQTGGSAESPARIAARRAPPKLTS